MRRGLAPLLVALASAARRPGAGTQSSVGRLLVDIDQSVRTAQSDAEMVFASLFSYDHQLDQSLAREARGMNETLARLSSVRRAYLSDITAARTLLQQLSATAHRSERNASLFQATATETGKRFESLSASAAQLVRLLQGAEATPEGALLTPDAPDALADPTKVYAAVGEVLAADRGVAPHFPEVFATFGQVQTAAVPFVRMTPALLKRTVVALSTIQARLGSQKERSLAELETRERGLSVQAATAEATEARQRGMRAEKEHAVEELAVSAQFTEAVLRMDADLRAKVGNSMKSKAELVERIRLSRQGQLKTLKELLGLMGDKHAVDEDGAPPSLSFLEVKSGKESPKDSLLFEIETAIHRKADTHGILLRIKGMLDKGSAVDAPSALSVVKELGSVLQTLDKDEARANAAKQRCEAQRSHAVHEKQDIKDNLAVMSVVQQHMGSAAAAAKGNLKRIAAKARALQTSAKAFSKVVSRAMRMLRKHSDDRATILAAVERARGVVRQARGEKSRALALLSQMRQELQAQERLERSYRTEEASLNAAFNAYIRNYLELLRERRAHYGRALSALELYGSEVAGDAAAQSGAIQTSGGLEKESRDLCASILKFYGSFHQRRLKLMDTLKELLPKMPELVTGRSGER